MKWKKYAIVLVFYSLKYCEKIYNKFGFAKEHCIQGILMEKYAYLGI